MRVVKKDGMIHVDEEGLAELYLEGIQRQLAKSADHGYDTDIAVAKECVKYLNAFVDRHSLIIMFVEDGKLQLRQILGPPDDRW